MKATRVGKCFCFFLFISLWFLWGLLIYHKVVIEIEGSPDWLADILFTLFISCICAVLHFVFMMWIVLDLCWLKLEHIIRTLREI